MVHTKNAKDAKRRSGSRRLDRTRMLGGSDRLPVPSKRGGSVDPGPLRVLLRLCVKSLCLIGGFANDMGDDCGEGRLSVAAMPDPFSFVGSEMNKLTKLTATCGFRPYRNGTDRAGKGARRSARGFSSTNSKSRVRLAKGCGAGGSYNIFPTISQERRKRGRSVCLPPLFAG